MPVFVLQMKNQLCKKIVLLLVFGLSLFMGTVAHARESVVAVEFSGLATVSEQAARTHIHSIEGTELNAKRLQSDLKGLYQSGLFSNVEVEKQKVPGGYKLIFKVLENSVVGKLTVVGNKKIKDDEIQEVLRIHEYEILDPAKIAETKKAILKLYEEKGYYLADVAVQIEPFDEASNQNELILRIRESRSVKIRRVSFLGNHAFSDKKLRKQMKTKEKGMFSFLSGSGKLENEKLELDLQRLRFYYLDNGYLQNKVSDPSVSLTRNKKAIVISVPVFEGDAFQVSGVDVAGDILTSREEILSSLKLKVKKTYRKSLEIEDLRYLERLYGDQAYAFANIVPHMEMNEAAREVKVTYFIQKGPKIKIDKIIIQGNKVTRDKVIRRELKVVENSYYSSSAIEMSRMRLMQLGYFEDVNIATPNSNEENKVNLVVTVKERENTGQFSIGAGFSTLENFIFNASIQKENFFGLGISGGVSAQVSKLRQNFLFNMTDRYFLDTRWQFNFSLVKYISQLNQFFDEDRFGGTIKFGREVFDFFNVLVGYQIEDVAVSNFAPEVPAFFRANATGFTSAVNMQVTYDRRDNRIQTTKGVYSGVTVEYSDEYFGATNNFFRVQADSRVYLPLPLKMVLKGRSYLGYINSMDNSPIGLFDRFFLGGVNTLRGFDLNSIGPQINVPGTATGKDNVFTFGGNKSMMFNVELEVPVYAPAGFAVVGFVDSGASYSETQDIALSALRTNYGFGFRWQSPFGPLRFEWGFPIDRRSGEPPTVFNFTIGQNF